MAGDLDSAGRVFGIRYLEQHAGISRNASILPGLDARAVCDSIMKGWITNMIKMMRRDVRAVLERDPAARTAIEALVCYPGLHAIWAHRAAHWMWVRGIKLPARLVSHAARWATGIEIHPGAKIGPGFFIDHGMGVVIGETAEVGADVTLYHGVTLGGTSLAKEKRHPTIEDRVVVGAGAKILGAITIGHDSRIGANAVVVKPVPPDSVVVGVPGEVVQRSQPRRASGPDLDHSQLPDVLGETLVALMSRVEALEKSQAGLASPSEKTSPHAPEKGVWSGLDFSI
ncbi:MAG: serine O-acetyltransferase [Vicinamibacteria bacterium]|nr:serine O-acetyltransferase [Vicinamibacteria bacterium]